MENAIASHVACCYGQPFKWTAIVLSALLVPVSASCAAEAHLTDTLFGSHMNDIALKVADLPQKYSDVLSRGLDFSPDGKNVAVESDGVSLNIWDWHHGRIVKALEMPPGANDGLESNPISYSNNARLLVACLGRGFRDEGVRIWDTRNWSIAKDIIDAGIGTSVAITLTPNAEMLIRAVDRITQESELMAYTAPAWGIAWSVSFAFRPVALSISPDGEWIAVSGKQIVVPPGTSDNGETHPLPRFEAVINIFSLREHKLVKVIRGDAIGPLAWSPDGRRIAVAGLSYVEIFDALSGQRMVHQKDEHTARMDIRFSPDGRFLIQSDMNGLGTGLGVEIWDSQHRKLLQHIHGNVASLAISRDGKYLALGETGVTTIWQFR